MKKARFMITIGESNGKLTETMPKTMLRQQNTLTRQISKLLVVQHEFGLYGGDYGEYIKLFLENVKKPVITTLHTVQPNFDQKAIEVLKYIVERSESIIVIAHAAIDMLKNQGISYKKCVVIPHGCPNIDCTNNKSIKESLRV